MKQTYIRCPRCELNYILKKDKFCNVCKQEMKALGTLGAEENLDLELCPLCKINYINPDEDICPACAKERELEEGDGLGKYDSENEWSSYTNTDDDDGYEDEETSDMVSISNLDDGPITDDDDMDLGLSDDEDEVDEDETFDSDFDDAFDNLDDDDDDDDDIDLDDDLDEDEAPAPKKRKKK